MYFRVFFSFVGLTLIKEECVVFAIPLLARSNICHRKGQFEESAENLVNANNMKLRMHKSEVDF